MTETLKCEFIEVTHKVNSQRAFIKISQLTQWQKSQPDIELYSSYFRYFSDDPYIGGLLAGLGFDFDYQPNPDKARREAVLVIKYLMSTYGIQEEDISICFSGLKGFHVWINNEVLNVQPHFYLPQIFKLIAKELIFKHGLKTLDLNIYDRRRLIRLPNSRHHTSQLYKSL